MTVLAPASAVDTLIEEWTADPVAFVLDTFPTDPEGRRTVVDRPQAAIMRSVAANKRTVVRASHGIGKTVCAAWTAHWWLATRYPARVVTAAGTWGHLRDKLWPTIRSWGRRWRLADKYEYLEMLVRDRRDPDESRIDASSSDKPENVEGFHSPNLLLIIDEAKAMPEEVYRAYQGALTQPGARVLILSTPPLSKAGWYPALFGPKGAGWSRLHFPAETSRWVSREYVQTMADDFGEGSPTFLAKVLGEIPEDSQESVIPLAWIKEAQRREPEPQKSRGRALGQDVARSGEDLSVMAQVEAGMASLVRWRSGADLMDTTGGIVAEAPTGTPASVVALDDTGLGGGVTDRLLEIQREDRAKFRSRLFPVNFGESAIKSDRFANRKAELWWGLREAIRTWLALPTDDELAALGLPRGSDLIAQLTAPIFDHNSAGKIVVYDKRSDRNEKTKALPSKSPDLAHALMLATWAYQTLQEPEDVSERPTTVVDLHRQQIRELLARERRPLKGSAHRRAR